MALETGTGEVAAKTDARGGWPAPALLLAVPIVFGLAALGAVAGAWIALAAFRAAGALPQTAQLVPMIFAPDAATGPFAAQHFALVGILFTCNGLIVTALVWALAKWSVAGGRRAAFAFRPAAAWMVVAAAVILPLIHTTSFVTVYQLTGRGVPAEVGFDALDWRMWAYPLGIVLVAPFAEEAMFRGWLFAGLAGRIRNVAWVVVLTALAWAAVHTGQGFAKAAALLPAALVLGWLRWKSGSLWPGVAGHVAMNAAGLAYMSLVAGD